MKTLLITLFKTYIFSLIISIALNSTYYAVFNKDAGRDYGHSLSLIASGSLIINIIIMIMTLPALFLAYPQIWHNVYIRVLLYFSGVIVFLITACNVGLKVGDLQIYLITGVTFLIVHTVFYLRLVKKKV